MRGLGLSNARRVYNCIIWALAPNWKLPRVDTWEGLLAADMTDKEWLIVPQFGLKSLHDINMMRAAWERGWRPGKPYPDAGELSAEAAKRADAIRCERAQRPIQIREEKDRKTYEALKKRFDLAP